MNYVSDPMKCKNGDYIVAYWYSDSMTVNSEKCNSQLSPQQEHCFIFRYNQQGKMKNKIQLNSPFPSQRFKLKLDSFENIYFPICTFITAYPLNDTFKIETASNSIIGIVKIAADFQRISFIKLGETIGNKTIFPGTVSADFISGQWFYTFGTNQIVKLVTGDTIRPSQVNSIQLLVLDSKLNIKQFQELASSNHAFENYGMSLLNNKILVLIKFSDSMHVNSLNKIHISYLRKINPTSIDNPNADFAILELQSLKVTNSYSFGSLNELTITGKSKLLHFKNGRYLLGINNLTNVIYDNQGQPTFCKNKGMNGLIIFDTSFNIIKYQALETTNKYGITFMDFFENEDGNLGLYAGTNKWFSFQSLRVSVTDSSNTASRVMKLYYFGKDSFIDQTEYRSLIYSFRVINYSKSNLLCLLAGTNKVQPNRIWNVDLNHPKYSQFSWLANFCTDVLASNGKIENLKASIKLFPNPVTCNSEFKIQFNEKVIPESTVSVFNASGKLVNFKEIKPTSTDVSLTLSAPGIYFIKLSWISQLQTIIVN